MGEDLRAKIDAAVGATLEQLLELARRDAAALAEAVEHREALGEATEAELRALAEHRSLLALT